MIGYWKTIFQGKNINNSAAVLKDLPFIQYINPHIVVFQSNNFNVPAKLCWLNYNEKNYKSGND